jgi:uncharacterized protein YfaS (alpha-2-macroglobulin family)
VVTPVVEAALMAPAAADRVGLWHREALVFTAPVDPGSEVVHGQISAQSLRAGGAELVMASEGAGPIDYRLELLAEARSGIDHGFDVDRVIVGLDGRPTRGLSSGEVFGIVVALSTREARRGAIVEIPLPGSMGLVDVEVAPTLSSARVEHVEQRPGCVVLFVGPMEEGLYEVSVALRAGAPGEYRVPGARVEDVEVPGAYGRSPSARVVVGP